MTSSQELITSCSVLLLTFSICCWRLYILQKPKNRQRPRLRVLGGSYTYLVNIIASSTKNLILGNIHRTTLTRIEMRKINNVEAVNFDRWGSTANGNSRHKKKRKITNYVQRRQMSDLFINGFFFQSPQPISKFTASTFIFLIIIQILVSTWLN